MKVGSLQTKRERFQREHKLQEHRILFLSSLCLTHRRHFINTSCWMYISVLLKKKKKKKEIHLGVRVVLITLSPELWIVKAYHPEKDSKGSLSHPSVRGGMLLYAQTGWLFCVPDWFCLKGGMWWISCFHFHSCLEDTKTLIYKNNELVLFVVFFPPVFIACLSLKNSKIKDKDGCIIPGNSAQKCEPRQPWGGQCTSAYSSSGRDKLTFTSVSVFGFCICCSSLSVSF